MKNDTNKRVRTLGRILFVVYLVALIYLLFFAEAYGRKAGRSAAVCCNLVPFREIRRYWIYRDRLGILSFLNLAGNVLGFLPFGFFLPVVHRRFHHGLLTTFLGGVLSLLVESVQLITGVGSFDVDDMILNTLGAALGYLCFLLCNQIRRRFFKTYEEI